MLSKKIIYIYIDKCSSITMQKMHTHTHACTHARTYFCIIISIDRFYIAQFSSSRLTALMSHVIVNAFMLLYVHGGEMAY